VSATAISNERPAALQRPSAYDPLDPLWVLNGLAGDVTRFAESYLDFAESFGRHRVCSADQAVEALQLVEQVRRMADVIAVQVLDDVVESRVADGHGHSSVRAMYDAVNKQSGRDLYGMEQVRKMFRSCELLQSAAYEADLSWEHLRLLGRVFSNRRVRAAFIDQQGWFLNKAARFDFRRFELLVNRWEEVNDEDGPEPSDAHERRNASATQDLFTKNWQRRSTHGPLVGAAMAEIEAAYVQAEFEKDWEAAKAKHGDAVCVDLLARTDAQRRADAIAQIYADAAANTAGSAPFNFVHNIVWTAAEYEEMLRRYHGAARRQRDAATAGCTTIDGRPLDSNEAFIDSLTSAFRRVVVDARGVTIDLGEQRFFTGLSRTALHIPHDECEWIGCHVPSSRCQADHVKPKSMGGPTDQVNGAILCQRHNRHKERGYTVWRDATSGRLRIMSPAGTEIT